MDRTRGGTPIKVLVVDDSRTLRMLLVHLLESDPSIRVVGSADSGLAALDFLQRVRPDVVLMDIHMEGLDGLETTRRIMATQPLPIVICTATGDAREVDLSVRALATGALACVPKPVGFNNAEHGSSISRLLETVKLMAEVPVVTRTLRTRAPGATPAPAPHTASAQRSASVKIIGIGASTGGPAVLSSILGSLPADFPVPILIVQHVLTGFISSMVQWLNQSSALRIGLASDGALPMSGHVYFAPDDCHLLVRSGGVMQLDRGAPCNGLRPAVARLFRSLADVYGPAAVGVLLSGMGEDGAAELKLLRERGAVTIVQDRGSSAVYGMPGKAVAFGAAARVLPAEEIAPVLMALVKDHHNDRENRK